MNEIIYLIILLWTLYIFVATYWIFKKIEKYEFIAASIIERYLSRRSNVNYSSHDMHSPYDTNVPSYINVSPYTNTLPSTSVPSYMLSDIPTITDAEDSAIVLYVKKINAYAPECFRERLDNIMQLWYVKLGIDLLTCTQEKILIKDEMSN